MGLFSFLSAPANLADGITQAKSTKGAVILDVRTREEYAEGHVAGSVNLPLDTVDNIAHRVSDKAAPLFVYCHSGARSARACAILEQLGYTATNIGGVAGYRGTLEK